MIKNFTDLEIWQLGKSLAVEIFKLWESIDNRGFFSLQDQMQRSALSIPSNIAEGSERKSAVEYTRFLYIAKGSAAELRTQLYIFSETGLSKGNSVDKLIDETDVLSRKIQKLISVISRKQSKP